MMGKIKILLLISFVLLSAACLGEGVKNAEMTLDTKVSEVTGTLNTTEITASEFMESYYGKDDIVIIDVRTKREYKDGYVPGAVHMPYTELESRIDELNLGKDDKIVLYCEAGVRSKKGANALLDMGFTNIIDVTDGIRGWKALDGDLLFPGIVATPGPDKEVEVEMISDLISAEFLSKALDTYKIVFLGPLNQYQNGHIPGSLHINPLTELVDTGNDIQFITLQKDDFEVLMGEKGIKSSDKLVLYDVQDDYKYAARFFWILKYYGHEKVFILDGGYDAWEKSGKDTSTDASIMDRSSYSGSEIHPEYLADLEYVNNNLNNPNVVLIEATTKEEFEKEGHIPGAVLVEPEDTLKSDGTVKSLNELSSYYQSKGITKEKEVITYCHTGYRGSTIWFELKHLLKYPRVRLYDGSLEEWNMMKMPLEKGISATTTTLPKTTTTTWIPKPTQTPDIKQSYLEIEPFMTVESLDKPAIVQMDHWDAVKIEDAYVYITGDFDGCSGEVWWYFNIYRDTPEGGLWEGKTSSYDVYKVHSNQDISDQIHKVSDVLDDHTIIVKKWDVQEGLTIEFSR